MKPEEILSEALRVLRSGGTLLYPTDTLWGLGCDATNPEAVARIFAIKHREDSKSLVLLASDLDMVGRYVKAIPSIDDKDDHVGFVDGEIHLFADLFFEDVV